MFSKPENKNSTEHNTNTIPMATVSSQPWWHGAGYAVVSSTPMLSEISEKLPPIRIASGAVGAGGSSQADDRTDNRANISKESQVKATQSGSERSHGQEQQAQHTRSAVPHLATEYCVPHTQLELGHTLACRSHPYSEPSYGGIVTSYGMQALVHPQMLGIHHSRMALPLEVAEEPVYVNAKQYHGILRRRQSRAKAELEKKLIKVRKPYLHESRHQHAMRRARGSGGRFLNTKNLNSGAGNTTPKKVMGLGPAAPMQSMSSSGSEPFHSYPTCGSFIAQQEVSGPSSIKQDVCERPMHSSGNGCYQQHSGFQQSAFHSLSGERGEEGDYSRQQRGGMFVGQAQNRAVAIQ